MAASKRDELIARNRARSQRLRSSGPTLRPPAPTPRWRRTFSHVYAVFVVCLVLAVADLIGGRDYVVEVLAKAAPYMLGLAAFSAVFYIGGHYWPKLRLILYGGWLVAGAVLGVTTHDEQTIGALWGLGFLGLILLLLHVVTWRKRRRQPPTQMLR